MQLLWKTIGHHILKLNNQTHIYFPILILDKYPTKLGICVNKIDVQKFDNTNINNKNLEKKPSLEQQN